MTKVSHLSSTKLPNLGGGVSKRTLLEGNPLHYDKEAHHPFTLHSRYKELQAAQPEVPMLGVQVESDEQDSGGQSMQSHIQ